VNLARGLRVMRGVNLARGLRVMRGVNLARFSKDVFTIIVYMI
jgi:hypothetical protein